MARRFFKPKPTSIQDRIDEMRLQQKRQELERKADPGFKAAREEAEEQEYIRRLEAQLKGDPAAASPPRRKPPVARNVPPPPPRPPEEEEDERDPYEAEREVQRMVEAARERERRAVATPAPPPPAPVPEAAPPPLAGGNGRDAFSPPSARKPAVSDPYERQGNLPYPPGTIVRLSDDSVGIIREEIPSREYDLVYLLCSNGRVEPRGILLSAYHLEPLGRLPREELERIEKRMAYDRDRVIYHLDDIAFAAGIPKESASTAPDSAEPLAPTTPEPFDDGHSMQRGRSISIVFGDKAWNAVYWGEDSLGKIVAHRQNGEWELMHLDLARFGESVKAGRLLTNGELHEIEDHIVRKKDSLEHKR